MDVATKKAAVKFHHLAIPTKEMRDGETHRLDLGYSYVPGSTNRYGIEWIRFHQGTRLPQLLQANAHVAFEVHSIAEISEGEHVIVEPFEEQPGVTAAYIELLDFPVKLMEIDHTVAGPEFTSPLDASAGTLRYHHCGIPRVAAWEREIRVPHLKLAYLPGKYNAYGVELLRFEEGNPNPDVIKYVPHVAFEVDDMNAAMLGEKLIYGPNRETPGIAVSMIEVADTTVEFIELDRTIVGDEFDA
ncbi:MAG: hypothetical protein NTZ79_04135 [Proteobacteria bacterium]|nr:hypothetical protein [Pseudomonadota bacterium]